MVHRFDLSGLGVAVDCTDEGGPSALRVHISQWSPGVIRIQTPTIYNRTEWTAEQARLLRDVLDAALREVGQ